MVFCVIPLQTALKRSEGTPAGKISGSALMMAKGRFLFPVTSADRLQNREFS
jgi:hypothetical protein